MSKRKYFGTDGIRGRYGEAPMTLELAWHLGQVLLPALGLDSSQTSQATILIGRDTRASGIALSRALSHSLESQGATVLDLGILPTPAIAHLLLEQQASLGIVLSASHNPAQDNGIKCFAADGYKLSDDTELRIETLLEPLLDKPIPEEIAALSQSPPPYHNHTEATAQESYLAQAFKSVPELDLSGLRISLDLANGAAYQTTPLALQKLGAQIKVHHAEPDGSNINAHCGCTHPDIITKLVLEQGSDIGISHDGDADRVLLVDETGALLDGDDILAIAADDLLSRDALTERTLVSTLMSNAGLDAFMEARSGTLLRTSVGDRYVIEAMKKGGLDLGGETSGHFIFHQHGTTGDGLIAALQILSIMQRTGKKLSQLRGQLTKFPQLTLNLPVPHKPALESLTHTQKRIQEIEQSLGKKGRTLLRYSGTESLIRVLLEGPDQSQLETWMAEIKANIEQDMAACS